VFHLMMLDQVTIRYGPRWRKSCLNAVRLSDGAYQQFNGDEERPAAKHEHPRTSTTSRSSTRTASESSASTTRIRSCSRSSSSS